MEEYFEVLNEKGEYTGEVETREKCHKEGLWHKAVVVFIINSKNQVLLQKRSGTKKLWPNMWDVTAGGQVLEGEMGFQAERERLISLIGLPDSQTNATLEQTFGETFQHDLFLKKLP